MHKYVTMAHIDTREKGFEKKSEAFFKTKGIDTNIHALGDYGDIALLLRNKKYLNIERKEIKDFCLSYMKNHLQDQCLRMHQVSKNPAVIIHGQVSDLQNIAHQYPAIKKIKKKSIEKMISNIQINYKVPVFWVENEAHFFLKVMELAETIVKNSGDNIKVNPSVNIRNRPDVDILVQANKVGEKTALLLLKEFKTPENVLNASREDLLKIKGIGDSTVSDIKSLRKVFYEGI